MNAGFSQALGNRQMPGSRIADHRKVGLECERRLHVKNGMFILARRRTGTGTENANFNPGKQGSKVFRVPFSDAAKADDVNIESSRQAANDLGNNTDEGAGGGEAVPSQEEDSRTDGVSISDVGEEGGVDIEILSEELHA